MAVLFSWNMQGQYRGLAFYMDMFAAALVLPGLLMIVEIVLDVIDIRIQSWFRSLAFALSCIGVFATTFAYAVPGTLKSATLFTIGLHIAYRLLGVMF